MISLHGKYVLNIYYISIIRITNISHLPKIKLVTIQFISNTIKLHLMHKIKIRQRKPFLLYTQKDRQYMANFLHVDEILSIKTSATITINKKRVFALNRS